MGSDENCGSDAGTGNHVDLEDVILEYLETHETIKPSDIKDWAGKTRQTISSRLNRMGDEGTLEKTVSSKGYVVWKKPTSVLENALIRNREAHLKAIGQFPFIPLHCKDVNNAETLLDDRMDRWLLSDSQMIMVLGDYGSGKTLYSKHLYCRLAEKYLEKPGSERLPIRIELKRYVPREDYLMCMASGWHQHEKGYSNKRVYWLNKKGKLIFILDGFDEMPSPLQNPYGKFQNLSEIFSENCKIVLTSRTAHFKRRLEEEKMCTIQDPTYTGFLLNARNTEICYISDFTRKDIDTYLRQYYGKNWKRKKTKMDNIYDLSDLAKRPILLNVICQTLPRLNPVGGRIEPANIYHEYTTMWLEREKWKGLQEEDILRFMTELALDMNKNETYEIHYSLLKEKISKTLANKIFSNYDLEDFDNKIRTCTFLHRDRDGNYSFIHKSFMEYFVARGVREAVETGDVELLQGVQRTEAVEQFLRGMGDTRGA